MPFTNIIPVYMPRESKKAIGFIVSEDYDERNIKVVQDVALSVIRNNLDATFIVYSPIDKITEWISDYLKIHKIPKERKIFVYPEGCEPKSEFEKQNERCDRLTVRDRNYYGRNGASPVDFAQKGFLYHGNHKQKDVYFKQLNSKNPIYKTLQRYKSIIGAYELDSVIIFTDDPKSTEVKEIHHSAMEYKYQVITVTSDGDFDDITNPTNPHNHKTFYGGIYRHEHYQED